MIAIATHNLQSAGVAGFVTLDKQSAEHLKAPAGFETGLVITNPPYGERMGDLATLPALYKSLGECLRVGFAGWRTAVLTSEPELERALGLRPDKQYVLFNGAIECRLDVCEVREAQAANAPSVLSPAQRSPSRSSVLTLPQRRARSDNASHSTTASSLSGKVTFAPRPPSRANASSVAANVSRPASIAR